MIYKTDPVIIKSEPLLRNIEENPLYAALLQKEIAAMIGVS